MDELLLREADVVATDPLESNPGLSLSKRTPYH